MTPADLIRNYLLMGHSYDNQVNYYYNYWAKIEALLPSNQISAFIRDYLTLKTYEIANEKKVYDTFKKYCSNNNITNEKVSDLLEELLIYAKWYSWFYYKNCPNMLINDKLSEITILKSTVVYPYLLNLFYKCYSESTLTEEELCGILNLVLVYLFRRLLCDYPTNALNKIFKVLKRDVENNWKNELNYISNLGIVLYNRKGKTILPSDELVKQYLLTKDMYNFKYKRYLFEKIETFNNKEMIDLESLTIEHIMPQKLSSKWIIDLGKNYQDIHEKYLHNIGNLTLTGYNSELSNKSFLDKKNILIESNIKTNRMLCEYDEWTPEEIIDRAKEIINKIIEIWSLPKLDKRFYNTDKVDISGEIDINEEVNVTNKKPYELTILGEKMAVTSWRNMFIIICEFFYEYDKEIFKSLVNHSDFVGRNRAIISDQKSDSGTFYQLDEKIYLQTTLNANAILNYIKLIIEKYDGFENETTYKIR